MGCNRIDVNDLGFRVTDSRGRVIEARWEEVVGGSVYAIDAITTTVRMIDIDLVNGSPITVTDQDTGVTTLLHALQAKNQDRNTGVPEEFATVTPGGAIRSFSIRNWDAAD